MRIVKRLLASVMALILLIGTVSTNIFASETNVHEQDIVLTETEKSNIEQLGNLGIDTELVIKLLKVSNHIYFSDDQKSLRIDLNDKILMEKYGFTNK